MTVEEIRGCLGGNNEIDRFPIGMRVLAVDDDPTCLKLLDGLLRKCQYQVTTTNQAITALKMLREDRNRFDLIISDVHMPDMDGFKLLELVGLEMDLPVIMLSGNSDPKLVMKGITHGACDYLVKPVRLEELRNVWQHVIRKKVESKSQPKSNNNKSNQESEGGQESGGGDQNGKVSRKRKDEDEDGEDNENENDDSSTQKKPRVVWSIDLHRKFVAAVNQLGIEKAVPKRILDMMNVEGLTRENVASHLQKYRLYLKRISQQANMVVAFGGNKDTPSYMRMGSLDGDFRSFSSSIMPNSPLSSYSSSGMLARLNSATSMTLHSLASPSLIHPAALPMTQNHQNSNPFQGISSSFDFDHLQKSRQQNTQLANFNSVDESRIFKGSSTFKDPSVTMGMNRSETFNIADQSQSQQSRFSSNTLSMGGNFPGQLPPNDNLKFSFSGKGDFSGNITTTAPVPLEAQSGGCLVALSNQNQKQGQYGQQDYGRYSSNAFNALSSSAPLNGGSGGLVSRSMDQIGGVYDRSNGGSSNLVQCSMRSGEDHLLEQTKLQGEFVANNGYDTLDDLMNGMMKREQDPVNMMEGEFGFDPYAFGSCI